MRALRLLVGLPASLRFLRVGGTTFPASPACFVSPILPQDAWSDGPGGLGAASPNSFGVVRGGDDEVSQVPGEPQGMHACALRPRRDLSARPSRRFSAAFRSTLDGVGSRNGSHFGAQ